MRLVRPILATLLWLAAAPGAAAEPVVEDVALEWTGDAGALSVRLSAPLGWRIALRDTPPEIGLELDSTALTLGSPVRNIRLVPLRDGVWRVDVALPGPAAVRTAAMRIDPVDGSAELRVDLMAATPDPAATVVAPLTVAIDPGHGGDDRGAVRGAFQEADIVLNVARRLAGLLSETPGVTVVLTRAGDDFLPLEARTEVAQARNADLLVSLHADALPEGQAKGAAVYVRGADPDAGPRWIAVTQAADPPAAPAAGPDPPEQSVALAAALAAAMDRAGLALNTTAERQGDFVVLRSEYMPSVLVELGFLSDPGDRARLADPAWRGVMALALRDGLLDWAARRDPDRR